MTHRASKVIGAPQMSWCTAGQPARGAGACHRLIDSIRDEPAVCPKGCLSNVALWGTPATPALLLSRCMDRPARMRVLTAHFAWLCRWCSASKHMQLSDQLRSGCTPLGVHDSYMAPAQTEVVARLVICNTWRKRPTGTCMCAGGGYLPAIETPGVSCETCWRRMQRACTTDGQHMQGSAQPFGSAHATLQAQPGW